MGEVNESGSWTVGTPAAKKTAAAGNEAGKLRNCQGPEELRRTASPRSAGGTFRCAQRPDVEPDVHRRLSICKKLRISRAMSSSGGPASVMSSREDPSRNLMWRFSRLFACSRPALMRNPRARKAAAAVSRLRTTDTSDQRRCILLLMQGAWAGPSKLLAATEEVAASGSASAARRNDARGFDHEDYLELR